MVRLNRKEIGDEDARLIASIPIAQFKGQINYGDSARNFTGVECTVTVILEFEAAFAQNKAR
jgi:hypothetical protein